MMPHLPASSKLHGLDHLRAIAIIFVFMYHYGNIFPSPEWLTAAGKFGWTGVDLFFVLSGYLISAQLFAAIARGESISLRTFFLKRFFRIIPAYVLVLTIYFCFPAAREREAPAPLWKYLSFTQNLGLDLRTQGSFSHAWSLCIEEQFYLLFPLILIGLVYFKAFRTGAWMLPLLLLGGLVIRWYVYDTRVAPLLNENRGWVTWYKWIYYPTFSRLDGLLSGVAIAAIFRFRPLVKEWLMAHGYLLLLLSLFILTGAYVICINERSFDASVFGFLLVSIGYALMVLGAISRSSFLYKFKSVITAKIAALSYGIYLTHKIVIHLTQEQFSKFSIDRHGNQMLLISIITCLAAAWLLNELIEKPFLKIKDKILARRAQ